MQKCLDAIIKYIIFLFLRILRFNPKKTNDSFYTQLYIIKRQNFSVNIFYNFFC